MKVLRTTRKEVIVAAPPAKAYTLRAIMLSGLAGGTSRVYNPLLASDQLALIESLERLGVSITRHPDYLEIRGGGGRFEALDSELNLNESGVGMNFLISAAGFASQPVILTGKPGLLKRPVGEIVDGLRQLGCRLEYLGNEGFPPVKTLAGGIPGGKITMSGAKNSQYFSSLAISAPYAGTDVDLNCSDDLTEKPYFDISLEMMEIFGVKARREGYRRTVIPAGGGYQGTELTVEGDYSSASYYFIAAAVCGNKVRVSGLNPGSLQGDKGTLSILAEMGCRVETTEQEITVKGGDLQAVDVNMADIPDMVPSIAVAAAFASGTTVLRQVGHLRFKECNRLEALVTNLARMGVKASYDETSLYIEGNRDLKGAEIDTYNDHRIAMSFAAAGLACGDIVIRDEECVGKSFPDFWERLKAFYA